MFTIIYLAQVYHLSAHWIFLRHLFWLCKQSQLYDGINWRNRNNNFKSSIDVLFLAICMPLARFTPITVLRISSGTLWVFPGDQPHKNTWGLLETDRHWRLQQRNSEWHLSENIISEQTLGISLLGDILWKTLQFGVFGKNIDHRWSGFYLFCCHSCNKHGMDISTIYNYCL